MIRVDLHLHSQASGNPAGFFSDKLGMQESYVSPRQVYDTLKERGMTLFTLTDHNSIEGCLEIANLPGVFVSEEITAYFPEDRCKIHVIAIDITEEQHKAIQEARRDVYRLVDYLQEQNIVHILAHPLYDMDGKLSRTHIEKCLLLFDNWELVNGTRSRLSSQLTREIAEHYTGERIDDLANKYGFNKRKRKRISWTGGSDDHGGMDVGTTFTHCEGSTLDDLKRVLESGSTEVQGHYGSPVRLTHMIMNISYQWLKNTTGAKGMLFESLLGSPRYSFVERLMGADGKVREHILKVAGITSEEAQGDRHELIHAFFKNFFPSIIRQFTEMKSFDFEKFTSLLGKSIFSAVPTFFYLSTYWQRAQEKRRSREIHRTMVPSKNGYEEGKIAYFTDTLNEINGVALTSRKLLAIARERNDNITFITCYKEMDEDQFVKNFAPMLSFPLPEYPEIVVNIPHFLEMLEYCDRENFDVIYASTPGVVGLYAFAIAKILDVPFVTTFHTDFPGYVQRYTGDHMFTDHVWTAFAMLFNNAKRVLSPSREYRRHMVANGVKKKKITVFSRGVNKERFNTKFRNRDYWKKFDAAYNGETVILFVGRVAKEKNIDLFLQTYELVKERTDVKFAIVGDGPYKEEIYDEYKDKMIFTGYQSGEELSTAYASADVFLFPSTSETFGNVVLEAQGAGLPVLVSGTGAVKENMLPGETGFVIEDNNPFTYARKLEQMLNDRDLLERMRTNALEYTRDKGERELLEEMLDLLSLGKLKTRG